MDFAVCRCKLERNRSQRFKKCAFPLKTKTLWMDQLVLSTIHLLSGTQKDYDCSGFYLSVAMMNSKSRFAGLTSAVCGSALLLAFDLRWTALGQARRQLMLCFNSRAAQIRASNWNVCADERRTFCTDTQNPWSQWNLLIWKWKPCFCKRKNKKPTYNMPNFGVKPLKTILQSQKNWNPK